MLDHATIPVGPVSTGLAEGLREFLTLQRLYLRAHRLEEQMTTVLLGMRAQGRNAQTFSWPDAGP